MEQKNSVESFINKRVYIDSNILMDKKCGDLLAELIHNKIVVKIPQIQYDEIYNLSKSTDSEKSFAGRNALRNIESLLDGDLLEKLDVGNTKNTHAYADPEFIKLIFEDLNNGQNIIFITEDRDLRIQIKIKLKDNQHLKDMIKIYSLDELSYPLTEQKEQLLKQQKEEIEQKRKDKEVLKQRSMGYEFCPNCEEFVKPKEKMERIKDSVGIFDMVFSIKSNTNYVNLISYCPYCSREFGRIKKYEPEPREDNIIFDI